MRVERFAVNSCFSQREGQSQKINKDVAALRLGIMCLALPVPSLKNTKLNGEKKPILPFQADVGYIAAKKCINCWAERRIKEDSFSQKAVQFFILRKKLK